MPDQERRNPTPVRADDALKYAAAVLKSRTSEFTAELECAVLRLAAQFGDGGRHSDGRYSDGRLVETTVEIVPEGNGTVQYVWHPDPTAEQPQSSVTDLRDDPYGRSSGFFEVTIDPVAQQLRAHLVRL